MMFEEEETMDGSGRTEKELVTGSPVERNWRGVAIALLVILTICAVIAIAVLLLTKDPKESRSSKTRINLSDFLMPSAYPHDANANFISDRVLTFNDEERNLWKLETTIDADQNSIPSLIKRKILDSDIVSRYIKALTSPDGKYVAMHLLKNREFRRSSLWSIHIFKVTADGSGGEHKSLNDDKPIRLFKWAPMSFPAACIFIDFNNNIWYQSDVFDLNSKIQITTSGSDFIYNGLSDWMYEEEILETDSASYFSPSGSKLAFLTINDTLVKHVTLDIYEPYSQYARSLKVPYPKVGEVLPSVELFVFFTKIKGKKGENLLVKLVPPPEVQQMKQHYFISGLWLNGGDEKKSEIFAAIWSNRVQNTSFYSTCKVPNEFQGSTVQCQLNYRHDYQNTWMSPELVSLKISTPKFYFTVLPRKMNDSYLYNHVAYFDYKTTSQTLPRFASKGLWDVTSIVGFNAENDTVYFLAAYPNATSRQLLSQRLSDNAADAQVVCLTCHLRRSENCSYFGAQFSGDGSWYVLSCQGPSVPKTFLISTKHNQTISVLTNNTAVSEFLNRKMMPIVRFETIDLGNGYNANVKLLLPPGAENLASGETFPLLLRVYSGPGTQMVTDQFTFISFETYLASTRNFIIAYVDGRGSGNRGSKYTSAIYRRLGTVEIEDQIKSVQLLLNMSTIIRRDAVGVWGWSYGGFSTSHIVKMDKFHTFTCAAAVAPVTNFLYYDAAYTERFMGTNSSDDNYDGYRRTMVASGDMSMFNDGKFFLAHGTADDNVHFQNSLVLTDALIRANVEFKFMAYPNQQHSIMEDSQHLYTSLDRFFARCLSPKKFASKEVR